MNKLEIEINSILSDWNPIGVDKGVSQTEYSSYIPQIMKSLKDEETLMRCLINILQGMGIDYDPKNKQMSEDLENICRDLLNLKL